MKFRKRFFSAFLAIFLVTMTFLTSVTPMTVYAAHFSGRNIWSGRSEIIFGQNRSYMYRWFDDFQNTFCIEPGLHMGRDVQAHVGRYHILDEGIPYISSTEDFQRLALICDWFDRKAGAKNAPNDSYAAAQVAVWSVIAGQWESASEMAAKVHPHINGNVNGKTNEIIAYVDSATSQSGQLPSWCAISESLAAPQNMTMVDGQYQLQLDISNYPDLNQVIWSLPSGFQYRIINSVLNITYNGTNPPSGFIVGELPESMSSIAKNSEWMAIYTPDNIERDQAMISAGASHVPGKIYINIGGANYETPQGGEVILNIYRHKEIFTSDYKIELEKYCAETGQLLEGATFEVSEAFDSSQLGDGKNGTVSKLNMAPKPAVWDGARVCGLMLTDSNGYASHSDHKTYHYNKTYCSGHPEPEYLDVPEPQEDEESGEITNEDEIQAVEEENQRLQAEWESLIRLCEEETDFHDVNEGNAEQEMLDDRDETYQTFINLQYQYIITEKTARPGYIIHGNHNDDVPIELIITDSSQAGANEVVVSGTHTIADQSRKVHQINGDKQLTGISPAWNPKLLKNTLPVTDEREDLSNLRTVIQEQEADRSTPARAGRRKSTDSNAKIEDLYSDDFRDWQILMERETLKLKYQYMIYPRHKEIKSEPETATKSNSEKEEPVNFFDQVVNWFWGKDTADNNGYSFRSLPEPENDAISEIVPGPSGNISYTYKIEDHRTEGEIHINKKDLELYNSETDSYGQTQGDATLEGAVYGLFAMGDLIHPDGKTGVVYQAGDMVSIGTTDHNGDASFLCITEESDKSITSSNKKGTWIGQPLLLGSYYIKELSRSEGYELSVDGIHLTESNRQGEAQGAYLQAGEVSATGLSHRVDEQDGSWNDTTVMYYKTENGFDVVISGYPAGTEIYQVKTIEDQIEQEAVTDRYLAAKTDENGAIIYRRANGGERKMDAAGNPILSGAEDLTNPETESWYTYHRLSVYPSGVAEPQLDPDRWFREEVVDADYIKEEVNDMLGQLGYGVLSDLDGEGAPWVTLALNGTNNQEIGTEILDWYVENNFYNWAAVESVFEEEGIYKARLFYDYKGQRGSSFYDSRNRDLYVKKQVQVVGGSDQSHIWIKYGHGMFVLNGFYATVSPKKVCEVEIPFGESIEDYIIEKYNPLYEQYMEGEILLDQNGNQIPEMEWHYIYGSVIETTRHEELILADASYDPDRETYTVHVDNDIDWDQVNERQSLTYRVQTAENSIVINGSRMNYSDYLIYVKGAGVTVVSSNEQSDEESYIRDCHLVYPGQMKVYQDGGTRAEPVTVLQRVIRQSIEVTKDISKESYENYNTYKIHRDPFTVLFGGYAGPGKKYIPGFHFKLYLVSDLLKENLLEVKSDGTYDYRKLFEDESRRSQFDRYAVEWDKPEMDLDADLTTLHASEGNGNEPYYGRSVMLPYGTYVVVEQVPGNLVNKHYELDEPKEVILPFVPNIEADGSIDEATSSTDYLYFSSYSPEELASKFLIRFNEENHVIQAHNHDGDFEVYKYGLDPDLLPEPYGNAVIKERYRYGKSENHDFANQVYYELLYDNSGTVIDYGVTLDHVSTMTGISRAENAKYAQALVPWSILDPRIGTVINDNGDVGNRLPGVESGSFNFIGFVKKHFENKLYSSKLRVEKIDGMTGENIIHDGAIFKIFAASRDVRGDGPSNVVGSGNVLFETVSVTGTRPELEARGDVDHIIWDPIRLEYTGTVTRPVYNESEQVFMLNKSGTSVGIFKAFSTETEVVKQDGSISREKVGYLETYQPLGAGVYVLVEVQAPKGYQKSKPIAFEIYKDQVAYYQDGNPNERRTAERYQYLNPLSYADSMQYEDHSRVTVTDQPSKLFIHKVEDGDQVVGDRNGLDFLNNMNDNGDLLTYLVRGKKEYLEARGDVEDIIWDAGRQEYSGTVSKTFEQWSEDLVAGTEEELRNNNDVKLLYEVETGYFSGYGIRFNNYITGAAMSLYEGLELTKLNDHEYEDVRVTWSGNEIISIIAYETGDHLEIKTRGRDLRPPYYPIWDADMVKNVPVNLMFYDLSLITTEVDLITNETWMLDQDQNRICNVDPHTGMAYIYDDYGRLIAYKAENGQKILAESIAIHDDQPQEHIYINILTQDDEHGLPLYYESGEVTYQPETWITDAVPHEISRLPFGAYILEETEVPYHDGYVKAPDYGIVLHESSQEQHFYYQNQFTKLNLAKIDVTTKQEIKDAEMTLYKANRIEDESEKGYYLERSEVCRSWISGYEYDDNGNIKYDQNGNKIPTNRPHWIDHIPVGYYILEETYVPYDQGYTQSDIVEIYVNDTGVVQTGYMENDYTALEIKKYDSKTEAVLSSEKSAGLALYQAELDDQGNPLVKTSRDLPGREIPVYLDSNLIVAWDTEDGSDVNASGREVVDEYGNNFIQYEYIYHPIETTKKGYYYITESGTTMFHYLPVGYYVLVEEETPDGYATADPILIQIEDQGHVRKINYYDMPDVPLTIDISKVNISRGKEVAGAFLEIFQADKNGERIEPAIYSWYSGSDGVYSQEDSELGLIPEGLEIGDLKSHRIEYISQGDYLLVESFTPYGFLQSVEIPFSIVDTQPIQFVEMIDEIPSGKLEIVKRDGKDQNWLLEGAVFEFRNKTLDLLVEIMTTDETGRATSSNAVPIGSLNQDGRFAPYIYEVIEISSPDSHMINRIPFEFQFQYQDELTPLIDFTYDAVNDRNQVKISKKEITTNQELPGAEMMITGKYTRQIVDHWISTEQPHYVTGILPGEYLLIEIAVPGAGYQKAEAIEFTITKDMEVIPYIEMYDDHTKVEVLKVKGLTNTLLPGAKLQLKNMEGVILYQWTTTDEAFIITGLEPGTYILEELFAPSGYQKAKPITIIVTDTIDHQTIIYRNYEIGRDSGGKNETPIPQKPDLRVPMENGNITVEYQPDINNWWKQLIDQIPKLGDISKDPMLWIWFLTGFVSVAFLGIVVTKNKRNRKKRTLFLFLLFIISAGYLFKSEASNEPTIIKSDWFEEGDSMEEPEENYEDEDGNKYQLIEWEVSSMPIVERKEWIEEKIFFEGVENKNQIPKERNITIEESHIQQIFPIDHMEIEQVYWSDDFSFTIVVETYGVEFYQLGESLISVQEDANVFLQYKDILFNQLNLSADEYQVETVEWAGEQYYNEAGKKCRNAIARGRKRLTDYNVTYGGYFIHPQLNQYQQEAIYQLVETELEIEVSEPDFVQVTVTKSSAETKPAEESVPVLASSLKTGYTLQNIVKISIMISGILGIFLLMIGGVGWYRYRKKGID